MKKLLKYLKGYEKQCVLGPLFKLLEATFELLIPLVVASIVDRGIGTGDQSYVLKMCLVMIALGIIGLAMAVSAQYFSAVAAVGFSTRLRHALLDHILSLSYSQTDRLGTSTMVTRMTLDINQLQSGVNLTLRLLLRSPFVVFGAMIMAFTIDAEAALIFVGLIVLLSLIVFGVMLITMPMYRSVQSALDGVTSATRQNLAGIRVLRAFCKETEEMDAFRNQTEMLVDRQRRAAGVSALLNPVTFVVVNLAVILLVKLGAVKVDGGMLTQGLVIALYNYMTQILVELIKAANLVVSLTKAAASGNRIAAIMDMEPQQKNGDRIPDMISGRVEFRDVTAQYAGAAEPSLERISFAAEPGQTIGIIGGTGSGKTTLVNLIPRLYDAAAGQILIDGIPVESYNMESLRQQIGIVPQKAVLFKGTIRQNLLWGQADATDQQLWDALETAQAREVVKDKEGELDAPVEQGGVNFSGGQRQRLTIARALVRKPAILILDDSASALDYATDASLRMAIRNMKNPPTTFIVSQRAASVRYADQILVLDDGVLVGKGSHASLLESCSVYQEIYYSQFSREVTENG
ncbi:MAG: ABC transporter ATP-binding protein [Oscillospiraceae bacterium]|nr:ABC transporter ATP-binding protein [Oscillospiraceae bacterium]